MPTLKFAKTKEEKERERREKERARWEQQERQRRAEESARRAREEARRARDNAHYAARAAVQAADKEMAIEIINAGYRALSRKHHPDLGGSHDKMVALNRVCDQLRLIVGIR
jgi:hypothetical protein